MRLSSKSITARFRRDPYALVFRPRRDWHRLLGGGAALLALLGGVALFCFDRYVRAGEAALPVAVVPLVDEALLARRAASLAARAERLKSLRTDIPTVADPAR